MIGYDGKPIPKVSRGDLRHSNIKAFKENYAQINWGKPKKHKRPVQEGEIIELDVRRDRLKSDKH